MSTTKEPTSIAPKQIVTKGSAKVRKTGVTKHMPGCDDVANCKC